MMNILDRTSDKISEKLAHKLKSDLYTTQGKYEKAIEELELSFKKGISLISYLERKSFILIKNEQYEAVVVLIEKHIDSIPKSSSLDVLIINKALAMKKQGQKIDESKVRSITSNTNDLHLNIASACLLNEEVKAVREIKKAINKDYTNLLTFNTWPVIPRSYLDKAQEKNTIKAVS